MSKHTPGPWTLTHVAGSNFSVQRFEIRGAFGDKPNIYPIFNRALGEIEGARICVSPADARLIAAAPELLEACQASLLQVESYIEDAGGRRSVEEGTILSEMIGLCDQLTAAITRATTPSLGDSI